MKPGRSSFLLNALLCALLCGLASGCALRAPETPDSVTQEPGAPESKTTATAAPETHEPPARPFPPETLYSLLTAEIAGSRQQFEIALGNYAQQARETRDPQVAERATMIARYLNNDEIASESAVLWVELAPESDEALANAAVALMQTGRAFEAFEMSRRLQEKGKESLFQSIAANAADLSAADRETLLEAYRNQLQVTPADEQLLVGAGILLQMQGQLDEAHSFADQALKHNPDSVPATLLEANLLHQQQRNEEAVAKMKRLLQLQPDNPRLRLQYARILAHHDLAEAQVQFEALVARAPGDGDMLLSLGLIAMEREDFAVATNAFERLLDTDQHLSPAHFYLGKIAETQADQTQAVLHYLQVTAGDHFLRATINLLNILISQSDFVSASEHIERLSAATPEQTESLQLLHAQALIDHHHLAVAEKVLSDALALTPTSSDLLYARAMLYDKQDQLPATERDLRAIIKNEPENAAALNALGYILADRTERFDEASELLLKAISLSPNDAAILDSVGWLHYRTGDYPEALIYLRRAFQLYPDAEIAAHLGEVLWVINERQEALDIWQQGLTLTPESDIIKTTMDRLQVPAQ